MLLRIARGDVEVVVGARSAIFAPTPHLGLIVLDEEHESTFKQESAPRYHARDVAVRRAADQNVPLVLASATPSLESWHRAQRGEFKLVEMPRRVLNLPMPVVRTIDLRNEIHSKTSRGAISRPLHRAMELRTLTVLRECFLQPSLWLLAPALLIGGALQQFTAFTATRSDSMLVIAAAGVVYGSIALLGATRMNLWSIRKHLASSPLQGAEVD